MRWLSIIFFIIISISSVNANEKMTIKDYEDEIVNSCLESSTDPSTYFCIISKLYGMNQVFHIFRKQSTYTVDQWKYFLTLLAKHKFGNGFDWIRIDLEFKDYLNKMD